VDRAAILKYLLDLNFKDGDSPAPKDVKSRWKELCHKHHPDKGGDRADFIRVTHAYNMLTDLEYRHKHMIEEVKHKNHNGFGDLNIRLQVPVSFVDAFFGRTLVVNYNRLHLDPSGAPKVDEHLDLISEVVTLPAGSTGGLEMFLQGKGHKCNDIYGDALLVFTPIPHPKFRVIDRNVHSVEPILLETLLKGGKIEVNTLYGVKPLRVPPATRPGTQLLIKGCGVGSQNAHIVQADALFPTKDDLKTESWAGLGVDWEEVEEEDAQAQELQSMFTQLGGNTITFTFGGVR